MDKNKQPGINFETCFVKEITFKREPLFSKKYDLDIKFNNTNYFNKEKTNCTTELQADIQDKNGSFKIDITVIGIFSVNEDEQNMTLEHFIENNSMAMIFPYLREAIADITRRSGLNAVLLPPINIKAILDKKK